MKKKIMVIACSLLLAMPALSFAKSEKQMPTPNASAYEHANQNAKFKRSGEAFNNKKNKKIRAKKHKKQIEKEAVEAKKKAEEAQDKGEGQVKVKF